MDLLDEVRKKFGKVKAEKKRIRSNRIVSYTRVSDFRQSEEGDSIDTQNNTINECAKEKGFRIVKRFDILGESAKKGQERPSIEALLEYVKDPKNNISNIIIFHSSRLSRDGVFGSQLVDNLIELGIGIIDCDDPIDIFNFNGRLRQIMKFYEAEKDNNTRKTFFETNLMKKLRTGQTMGKPPIGYTRKWLGNGKNRIQRITIDDNGKMLKHLFQFKLDEYLTNVEIAKRMTDLGLKLSSSQVGNILSNVYYCGLISDVRLIEENGIIKGNHPAIISIEDFLTINSTRNINLCNKKSTDKKELPLRRHLVCPSCNTNMTGEYKVQKNQSYYRCRTKGCKSNTNTKIIHPLYVELLNKYSLKPEYLDVYQNNLEKAFKELNERNKLGRKIIKSKINELESLKIKTTQRIIIDYENSEDYKVLNKHTDIELAGLSDQLASIRNDIRGIETSIKNAIDLTTNISSIWENGCLETRILLQKTIFPRGVFYDKKSNSLNPVEVNKIVEIIPLINDSGKIPKVPKNPISPNIDSTQNNGNRTFDNNTDNSSSPMVEKGSENNEGKNSQDNDGVNSMVVRSIYTSNNYNEIIEGVKGINLFINWKKSNKIN